VRFLPTLLKPRVALPHLRETERGEGISIQTYRYRYRCRYIYIHIYICIYICIYIDENIDT